MPSLNYTILSVVSTTTTSKKTHKMNVSRLNNDNNNKNDQYVCDFCGIGKRGKSHLQQFRKKMLNATL